MSTAAAKEVETFLIDACKELAIPIRWTSPLELELAIPALLRRDFGNLPSIRATTSEDLRREDNTVEFLAPGSFVLECVTRILARTQPVWSVVVAGVVRPVEAEAYLQAFTGRFVSEGGQDGMPGRLLPSFQLKSLIPQVSYERYVRVLVDAKVSGGRPVHEVFPVVVRAKPLEVLPSDIFAGRPMYGLDEVTKAPPQASISQAALQEILRLVAENAAAKGAKLSVQARLGGAARLADDEAQLRRYYSAQIRELPLDAKQLQKACEDKVAQLRSRFEVATTLSPVSVCLVHDPVVALQATFADARDREYVLSFPTISGRPDVPDDVVRCGHFDVPLVVAQGEGLCCTTCLRLCRHCEIWVRHGACDVCAREGSATCNRCAVQTADGAACTSHVYTCASGETRRVGKERPCSTCGALTCPDEDDRHECQCCDSIACTQCVSRVHAKCTGCEKVLCLAHQRHHPDGSVLCSGCSSLCAADGGVRRPTEVSQCRFPGHKPSGDVLCEDHLFPVVCAHGPVCADHHIRTEVGAESVCRTCVVNCAICSRTTSAIGVARCTSGQCGAPICADHVVRCATCHAVSCKQHLGVDHNGRPTCHGCGKRCPSCADDQLWRADERGTCKPCATSVNAQPRRTRPLATEPDLAAVRGRLLDALQMRGVDRSSYCHEHLTTLACGHQPACEAHYIVTEAEHESVCASCAVGCADCGRTTVASKATACSSLGCGARLCRDDAVVCTNCGAKSCKRHHGSGSEQQALCDACGKRCSVCADDTLWLEHQRGECQHCAASEPAVPTTAPRHRAPSEPVAPSPAVVDLPDADEWRGLLGASRDEARHALVEVLRAPERNLIDTLKPPADAAVGTTPAGLPWLVTTNLPEPPASATGEGVTLPYAAARSVADITEVGSREATSTYCNDHLTVLACGHGAACAKHYLLTEVEAEAVCSACAIGCSTCGRTANATAMRSCSATGCTVRLCRDDAVTCAACNAVTCSSHRLRGRDGSPLCNTCAKVCATCGDGVGLLEAERGKCSFCGPTAWPPWRLRLASIVSRGVLPEDTWHCREHLTSLSCPHGVACPKHHAVTDLEGTAECHNCVVPCGQCSRTSNIFRVRICRIHGCETPLCKNHAVECASCGKVACLTHRGVTGSGMTLCADCGMECSACRDGRMHPRGQCQSCALCGPDAARLCPDHSLACSECQRPTCADHRGLSREGLVLCTDCGKPCSACRNGELIPLGRRSTCRVCQAFAEFGAAPGRSGGQPAWLCEAHKHELDCQHGPACSQHAISVDFGPLPVCSHCLTHCSDCGRGCNVSRTVECDFEDCDAVLCADHAPPCSHCGADACSNHRGTAVDGSVLCVECGEPCSECADDRLVPPDRRMACRLCSATICADHVLRCGACAADLCAKCAAESPIHPGAFCPEHLATCACCGTLARVAAWPQQLCELCAIFVSELPNPPLPFAEAILAPFIETHAGWRKTKAQVRWSVGRRYVLVWVKSGIIGKSTFATFDHAGAQADVCHPVPQKEWTQ